MPCVRRRYSFFGGGERSSKRSKQTSTSGTSGRPPFFARMPIRKGALSPQSRVPWTSNFRPSVLLAFFAMGLLILQVWMFSRFFVNVLFWQQFAVLENAGFVDSLRESRDLARSGRDLPWFQRPLWRGAFIASMWFALVLAVTLGAQWGTFHQYLNQLMATQDPQALLQQMTEAQQASGFNISAFALNVVEKILQPLVGIAFVVIYLDSKLELPSHVKPVVRAGEGDAVR